ncbi:flagellar basal-body MS-ring/collar protein FliF [Sphingosinicella sp. YJ22]|uniref:flagellar basal-body MS-ring/collar protein FliF n=1 Tax=Sphingosinicella sp. YJ22 TaxID=1104780 RepID=UPI00140C9C57|nr:flagellar basal-body MS-ring/collar protein FliF [Sphingosinicella sp. YJ22]
MSELAATPNDLTPTARPLPIAGGTGMMGRARDFMSQPAVIKALPAIAFVGLIGLAALLWMTFSQAPGRTLFSGLADSDKAAVVEALQGAGIAHQLDSSTGAVTVSEDDYHQARMVAAAQGLPRGAPDGGQVMENLPLGASRAVEGERIRAARQMDLARTIEAIDAVRTARVHIADNGQSVFVRDRASPGASVMLTLESGRSLSDGQVQAIIHLVASSIPNLNPEQVSVVDQNGRLLSRAGGSDGASGESERQLAVQQATEGRYREAIATLLTPILGAGNFTAEVSAEMDFSQTEASREAFPEASRALRSEQGTVTQETNAQPAAGGIPGTLANEAPPPATTTPDPNNPNAVPGAPATANETRRNEQYARNYAVGREISVTRQQTGTVKRLSVAVAVRNPEGGRPLTRDEIQSLENLIRGAVGFSQQRGDMVALTARSFVSEEATAVSWWQEAWLSPIVRSVGGLILALTFLLVIARPLMKRLTAAAARRAESRNQVREEIAAAVQEHAKTGGSHVTIDMIEAAPSYEARAELIRNFVRQDPARAALVVRDLIRADTQGAA